MAKTFRRRKHSKRNRSTKLRGAGLMSYASNAVSSIGNTGRLAQLGSMLGQFSPENWRVLKGKLIEFGNENPSDPKWASYNVTVSGVASVSDSA
jgi:hypothetical protein